MKFKRVFSSLVIAVVMIMSCAFGMVGCGGMTKGGGDILDGTWEFISWDGYGSFPTSDLVYDNENNKLSVSIDKSNYEMNIETVSKGKKTDYRTKTDYRIHHKGIDNDAMEVKSFSDNVMLLEKIDTEKTPGQLEQLTGKTIIRRKKSTAYVDKKMLNGTFTMPEDFSKGMNLDGLDKIIEMTIDGDKVSFVYQDRIINKQTFKATLKVTDHGYGFDTDLMAVEDLGHFIYVEIVETGDNYITLYYARKSSRSNTKVEELSGVTLVKA